MKNTMLAVLAVVAVGLTGCGHNLYLVGRNSGVQGKARIVTTPGNPGGDIALTLGGKSYTGRWVYMASGGSLGFGTATAFSGGKSATASGTFVGLPTGGNGSVLASASDGSQIRCVFNYSEWNNTGVGVCQDNHDEMYDLQIN